MRERIALRHHPDPEKLDKFAGVPRGGQGRETERSPYATITAERERYLGGIITEVRTTAQAAANAALEEVDSAQEMTDGQRQKWWNKTWRAIARQQPSDGETPTFMQARNELAQGYSRLATARANYATRLQKAPYHIYQDVAQAAQMRLVEMAEEFDVNRKISFGSYAYEGVGRAINFELYGKRDVIYVPQNAAAIRKKVRAVELELVEKLGRNPTLVEITAQVNEVRGREGQGEIEAASVDVWLNSGVFQTPFPIFPTGDADEIRHLTEEEAEDPTDTSIVEGDIWDSRGTSTIDRGLADQASMRVDIATALSRLTPQQRAVIVGRSFRGFTQEEIATQTRTTYQNIQQKERTARGNMRRVLEGTPLPKSGKPFSPDVAMQQQRVYEARTKNGMKPSEIAKRFGISLGTVRSYISREKTRRGGVVRPKLPQRPSEGKLREDLRQRLLIVRDMVGAGAQVTEIMEALGVSERTAYKYIADIPRLDASDQPVVDAETAKVEARQEEIAAVLRGDGVVNVGAMARKYKVSPATVEYNIKDVLGEMAVKLAGTLPGADLSAAQKGKPPERLRAVIAGMDRETVNAVYQQLDHIRLRMIEEQKKHWGNIDALERERKDALVQGERTNADLLAARIGAERDKITRLRRTPSHVVGKMVLTQLAERDSELGTEERDRSEAAERLHDLDSLNSGTPQVEVFAEHEGPEPVVEGIDSGSIAGQEAARAADQSNQGSPWKGKSR